MNVLFCPGRSTRTHEQFLSNYPQLAGMKILTVDVGSGDLPYSSGSNQLVFCSNERYHLELHKFLTIPPAHRYIRECWENDFGHGRDWSARGKFLAAFNNNYRPKVMRSWGDIAQYYCVLCMSSFYVSYDKWRLNGDYSPVTPDYNKIKGWSEQNVNKQITYYRRNIYNFPTQELDNNSIIYLHLPNQFAPYGCGYTWTKRKLLRACKDFTELAELGHKIIISSLYERWGHKVNSYVDHFQSKLFRVEYHSELKASKYGFNKTPTVEAYLIANL